MSAGTATPNEVVVQRSNFKVEITGGAGDLNELNFVKEISGGGINANTMQTQTGSDPHTLSTSARPNVDLLTITCLLTKDNAKLISNAATYLQDTQNTKRTMITLTFLDRTSGKQADGSSQVVWHDAILTSITHPRCLHTGDHLTVTTVWQANRVDNAK
jgi:hypothetical protein